MQRDRLENQQLPIYLTNPIWGERKGSLAAVGIPFLAGQLREPATVGIYEKSGHGVPAQSRVLCRWPDESVKWLLLDFLADVGSQAETEYRLRFGAASPGIVEEPHLSVTETPSSIRVSTGPLEFSVPKGRFGPVEDVSIRGRKIVAGGGEALVANQQGKEFRASLCGTPTVRIRECGPVKVVIEIAGKHTADDGETFLDFLVRLRTHAGATSLDLDYQFLNLEDADERLHISKILFTFPIRTSERARRMILQYARVHYTLVHRHVPADDRIEIRVGDPVWPEREDRHVHTHIYNIEVLGQQDQYHKSPHRRLSGYLEDREQLPWEGFERCDEWIDMSEGGIGLTTGVRHFAGNTPKSLCAEDGRIEYHIWPEWAGTLRLMPGQAKTHNIFLSFHNNDVSDLEREVLYSQALRPLYARTSFEHYQRCKVNEFDLYMPYKPERYPSLEDHIMKCFQRGFLPGMMDFGDDYKTPAGDVPAVWFNNEYDYLHLVLIQYLRTGLYRNFEDASTAARHFLDVDFCRKCSDPLKSGAIPVHWYYHTSWLVSFSHTFLDGLLDWYCLTGESEALEAAVSTADVLLRLLEEREEPLHGSSREGGWGMNALLAVYEITGEQRFLDGARKIIEAFARDIAEAGTFGQWYRLPDGGRAVVTESFAGISLIGIVRYHRNTGDPKARELFFKILDDALRACYSREGLWINGGMSFPQRVNRTYLNWALAYACELTGDTSYIEKGLRSIWNLTTNNPTFSGGGSQGGRNVRALGYFLKVADEHNLLDRMNPPY